VNCLARLQTPLRECSDLEAGRDSEVRLQKASPACPIIVGHARAYLSLIQL
jgi:hypothetical protein